MSSVHKRLMFWNCISTNPHILRAKFTAALKKTWKYINMKGHNELFKCYTESHVLISSKQVPSDNNSSFCFNMGWREKHSHSQMHRQGSHSHQAANADQDFISLPKFYVQHIQETPNFQIRFICLFFPFRYISLNIN